MTVISLLLVIYHISDAQLTRNKSNFVSLYFQVMDELD